MGFWGELKKPIIALAPMANVTDAAFRRIIAKYGKPDIIWTEFVSCDGLCSVGKEKLLVDLRFSAKERPIVAQFFGAKPENFYKCAQLAARLGFDGIDINMGCPDRAVEKQGAGAALMKNPKLAQEIIRAAQKGSGKLPVSVKTRIGYNRNELKTWLPALLAAGPAAVILHLRTRKEMSDVPAHWDVLGEAVAIRNGIKSKTLILGNGDIRTPAEVREMARKYGADGAMIGRAVFGRPWLFAESTAEMLVVKKLKIMLEHAKLYERIFKINPKTGYGLKNFDNIKKHFKAYASGFGAAKELRTKLMAVKNFQQTKAIVDSFLENSR